MHIYAFHKTYRERLGIPSDTHSNHRGLLTQSEGLEPLQAEKLSHQRLSVKSLDEKREATHRLILGVAHERL